MDKFSLTVTLCISIGFLFADQNLLSPNLTQIAKEFNFTPQERDEKLGGEIAFGFFIVGGFVAVAVGYLADRVNRCKLFSAIIILGELSCLWTYFSINYSQLLISRIFTGISIGGASPIVFSILGDLYGADSRVFVSACYGISVSIGVASGQLLSGYMGPIYGWRSPFLIIAIPPLLLALIILIFAKEPKRGDKDYLNLLSPSSSHQPNLTLNKSNFNNSFQHQYEMALALSKSLIQSKTIIICYTQGIFGCIPWSIVGVFLCDYISQDLGYPLTTATMFMTLLGIGAFMGQLFGGWMGQTIYNNQRNYLGLFMGLSTMSSTVPLLLIINSEKMNVNNPAAEVQLGITFILLGFLAAITGPNIRSVLQNVSSPDSRGITFAIFTLCDDVGRGGGPAFIAKLVRYFGNRRPAFVVGSFAWIICGLLLLIMVFTFSFDEAAMKDKIARRNAFHV